jgi:Fe-S oxidoreductase
MALGLSMAQKGDAKALSFVEDTAVAPERLQDYIAEFLALVADHGTTAGVYAHASVGCLHVRPVINLKTAEGLQRFESIAAGVADLVLKYGGALSGEHGDGLVRTPFQEKIFGPALYQAFCQLKQAFDPLNLLNPGKIVHAPPLTSNLRCGPTYVTPEVPTTFDFSVEGGIVRAAELCSGVGACRKKREGIMCPSYQATRTEQHSTRGRANALRLALTGQLGLRGLTDPTLCEVFDLCLECKACKSECPTNVDMARLKAEFLHQYYEKNGFPWRNRIFGQVARISKLGCSLAPLSNLLVGSRFGRWLNERMLGIDRRRMPPPFTRRTFRAELKQRLPKIEANGSERVVYLFPDTHIQYHQPTIGLAAMKVIHRASWRVMPLVAGTVCCGRPMISNGMLTEAIACAHQNVESLYPLAAEGHPIIACEPSCILTLRDDYPALLRGELRRQAETVAGACRTFEEFVDFVIGEDESGKGTRCALRPWRKGKILVQCHCHQRSLVGMEPTLKLLRRIPGAEVIDLDAGCCGMAGSFGYEKEHYEVSRLVGEQRLFPVIRQAGSDDVIVAPGFSCRMQIEHFTGRQAMHPATLLNDVMREVPG